MTTTDHRSIADLDAPREQLERELAVLRAARTATHSPSDRLAYLLDEDLVAHDKETAQAAVVPAGWAEHIAALNTKNKRPQEAS